MKENLSDTLGEILLKRVGFNIKKISETNENKIADFIGSYHNISVLIECKLKEDDKKIIKQKNKELQEKGCSIVDGVEGYNSSYESIIKKASKQIRETELKRDFNFLLFISKGINPMLKAQKIKSTLYGSITLLRTKFNEQGFEEKLCYGYTYSEFKKYNNIDACIVMTQSIIDENKYIFEICLNEYSKNFNKLESSNLLQLFKLITNPKDDKENGNAYFVDENISLKLDSLQKSIHCYNPILKHLKEKYNINEDEMLFPANFNTPEITYISG